MRSPGWSASTGSGVIIAASFLPSEGIFQQRFISPQVLMVKFFTRDGTLPLATFHHRKLLLINNEGHQINISSENQGKQRRSTHRHIRLSQSIDHHRAGERVKPEQSSSRHFGVWENSELTFTKVSQQEHLHFNWVIDLAINTAKLNVLSDVSR